MLIRYLLLWLLAPSLSATEIVTPIMTYPPSAEHFDSILDVKFSPDGKQILSGSEDRTARLWDVESGQVLHVLNGEIGMIYVVGFSADGKMALTIGRDSPEREVSGKAGMMVLWSVETGQEIRRITSEFAFLDAIFVEQEVLSVDIRGVVQRWNAQTGKEVNRFEQFMTEQAIGWPWSTGRFSSNGRLLLYGNNNVGRKLWDIWAGEEFDQFRVDSDTILSAFGDYVHCTV